MSTNFFSSKFAVSLLCAVSISPLLLGNMPAKAANPAQLAATPTTSKASNTPSNSKVGNTNSHLTATPTTSKTSKTGNTTTQPSNSTASKSKPKNSNSATKATTTYTIGSKGDMVKKIQNFLKQQKIYTGQVNGTFGQSTRQAVMKFQASHHLKGDGIVGSHTQQALQKAGLS